MTATYYDDGLATIYHGDCEDVLPSLPLVDMIFTSPPYNLGVTASGSFGHWVDGQARGGYGKWTGATANGMVYDDHDDAMDPAEYETWQRQVLQACWAQLTDVGAIFYNHKPRVQATTLWLPLAMNPGLPLRQIVTWDRGSGMNFAPTHYVPSYEWLIVFAKPDWRLKSKGVSGLGDVWRVTPDVGNEHPAPFPVALPGRALESTDARLVLDPFMGSGTTLRAAKDRGVPSIGIEKSERYCEMAARRLGQEVLTLDGAP